MNDENGINQPKRPSLATNPLLSFAGSSNRDRLTKPTVVGRNPARANLTVSHFEVRDLGQG